MHEWLLYVSLFVQGMGGSLCVSQYLRHLLWCFEVGCSMRLTIHQFASSMDHVVSIAPFGFICNSFRGWSMFRAWRVPARVKMYDLYAPRIDSNAIVAVRQGEFSAWRRANNESRILACDIWSFVSLTEGSAHGDVPGGDVLVHVTIKSGAWQPAGSIIVPCIAQPNIAF